jgi:hypothetical protein
VERPLRWTVLLIAACSLAACKREDAVQPKPVTAPNVSPAPATAPAPAAPAPSPPASQPAPAAPAANPAITPVETVAITSATLGNAVSADKRVTAATDTFRPADTIFIAVETSGAAGANLTARWTYTANGQVTRVNEETQKVPPGGPAVTEFHIRKPDGWPRGDYQVAVLVNDEVAVTKKFSVR